MNTYKGIRFFVMDVDGTLTDGKIYMGQDGELFKAFDVKDGYSIKYFLPESNIIPVIITARVSQIVTNRCKELGIIEIHQGCHDKLEKLNDILKTYSRKDNILYDLSNVAYVGDDVLDLQCIEPIRLKGGYTACPADAVEEVKCAVDYLCKKKGGYGAVREFAKKITTI